MHNILVQLLLSIVFMVLGSNAYRIDLGSDYVSLRINGTWTKHEERQHSTMFPAAFNRSRYSHHHEDWRQGTNFSAADNRSREDAVLQQITNRSRNRSNAGFEGARNMSAVASGSLGVRVAKVRNQSSTTVTTSRFMNVEDTLLQSADALRKFATIDKPTRDHPGLSKTILQWAQNWLNEVEEAEKVQHISMKDLSKLSPSVVKVKLDVPLRKQDATSECHVKDGRKDHDVWLWHATTRDAYRSILGEGQMKPGKAHGLMTGGIYMASSPVHAIRKAQNAFGTEGDTADGLVNQEKDMLFAAPVNLGDVFRLRNASVEKSVFREPYYSLFLELKPNGEPFNGAEWIIGNPRQIRVDKSIPFVWYTDGEVPVLTHLMRSAKDEKMCAGQRQCCKCTTSTFMKNFYAQKGSCCAPKKHVLDDPCQPDRCLTVFKTRRASHYTCTSSDDC